MNGWTYSVIAEIWNIDICWNMKCSQLKLLVIVCFVAALGFALLALHFSQRFANTRDLAMGLLFLLAVAMSLFVGQACVYLAIRMVLI